jgi:hypothetical protein
MAEQDRKPIILNLGSLKRSKKRIRELKKGEGKLADKVQAAIHAVHADLADGDVLPVVVLVEEKAVETVTSRGRGALFRIFDI